MHRRPSPPRCTSSGSTRSHIPVCGRPLGSIGSIVDVAFERFFPGVATKAVIQKVVAGAAMAPLVLSANFAMVGALKGHDSSTIAAKVKRDVGPTWLAGIAHGS